MHTDVGIHIKINNSKHILIHLILITIKCTHDICAFIPTIEDVKGIETHDYYLKVP